MKAVMKKDWFHGNISKEVSEELLAGTKKRTYLVRTSITGLPGTHTYLLRREGQPLHHFQSDKAGEDQPPENPQEQRWHVHPGGGKLV